MALRCPGQRIRENGRRYIKQYKDDRVIEAISDLSWYDPSDSYHRMFLHELYEEARRRGIRLTDPV